MAKVSKMLNAEKTKNEKLEIKFKQLNDEFEELKKNKINVENNSDSNNINCIYKTCVNCNENFDKEENNNFTCLTDYNINNIDNKRGSYSTIAAVGNTIGYSKGLNMLNSKSPMALLKNNFLNSNKNSVIKSVMKNYVADSNLNTSANNISRSKCND